MHRESFSKFVLDSKVTIDPHMHVKTLPNTGKISNPKEYKDTLWTPKHLRIVSVLTSQSGNPCNLLPVKYPGKYCLNSETKSAPDKRLL